MAITINPQVQTLQGQQPPQQQNCLIRCCKAICRGIANCFKALWDNLCCCIPCRNRQVTVQQHAAPLIPAAPAISRGDIDQLLLEAEVLDERDAVVVLAKRALQNPNITVEEANQILARRDVQDYEHQTPDNGLYTAIVGGDHGQIEREAYDYLDAQFEDDSEGDATDQDETGSIHTAASSRHTVISRRPASGVDEASLPGTDRDSLLGATGYTAPDEVRAFLDAKEVAHGEAVGIRDADRRLSGHEARVALAQAIRDSDWNRANLLFSRSGLEGITYDTADTVLVDETEDSQDILIKMSQLLSTARSDDRDFLQAYAVAYLAELGFQDHTLPERVRRRSRSADSSISEESLQDNEAQAAAEGGRQEATRDDWGGARPRVRAPEERGHGPELDRGPELIYRQALNLRPRDLTRIVTTLREGSQGNSAEASLRSIQPPGDEEDVSQGVHLARLLVNRKFNEAMGYCQRYRTGDRAYTILKRAFYHQQNKHLARAYALGVIYPDSADAIYPSDWQEGEVPPDRDLEESSMADEKRSPFASLSQSYIARGATRQSIAYDMMLSLSMARELNPATAHRSSSIPAGGDAEPRETEPTVETAAPSTEAAVRAPRVCMSCGTDDQPDPDHPEQSPVAFPELPLPCCSEGSEEPKFYCVPCLNNNASAWLVEEHFQDFVNHNNTVWCPYCDGRIDMQDYERYLTEENKSALFGFTLRAIDTGANVSVLQCPDCQTHMIVENPIGSVVTCMQPHSDEEPRELCVRCSEIWQPNHNCPLSRKLILEGEINRLRGVIDNPEKYRLCPGNTCDGILHRAGGCNHVECRLCTADFCWICLRKWDDCLYNSNPLAGLDQNYYRCRSEMAEDARNRRLEGYTERLRTLLADYKQETGQAFQVDPTDSDITRFRPRPQRYMSDSEEVDDAIDNTDHLTDADAAREGFETIPSSAARIRQFYAQNP